LNSKSKFLSLSPNGKFGRFLFLHFPAFAYAVLIYYVSSLQIIHPPSIGFSWEDKIYHFGEYAVLTIFVFIALKYYRSQFIKKHTYLLAGLFACFFAASDEIHQYFVPGRESTVGDLTSDCLGTIVALYVIWRFLKFINTKRD
jgi:VanZ family protein